MKCEICNEEIKGKGKKLGGGQTICKDCYKYTAMVRECDGCEKEFLVTDLARDPETGTYCWACIQECIEEGHAGEYISWDDWKECAEEEGEEVSVEAYMERHKETLDYYQKNNPYRRMLDKMLAEEIKKAA